MKKVLFFFLLSMVSISVFAQGTTDSTAKQNAKSNKPGKVYFLRSTGLNSIMKKFSLFIDDELVCKLGEKNYSIHPLKPGKHFFSVQTGGTKPRQKGQQIEINIDSDKSYYIQIILQNDIWATNIICQEVTEGSANKIMPNLKEEASCL